MRQITDISEHDLQILFVRYSKHELVKLLGIKDHEYYTLKKEKRLLNGCEFLKSSTAVLIIDMWRQFKSRGEMARFFRVSPSFLDTIFKRAFYNYRNPLTLRIDSALELKKALQTYGSKGIVAKLMGINTSDMNKLCKRFGIKHSDMASVRSGYESSKGLTAEKEFEKIRGTDILKNMNEIDPRFPYDYEDKCLGKVNVKSSKSYYARSKSKRGWYAKFNFNGGCDNYACFIYDESFRNLLYWFIVPNRPTLKPSMSVYHKTIKPLYKEGEVCVLPLDEESRGPRV